MGLRVNALTFVLIALVLQQIALLAMIVVVARRARANSESVSNVMDIMEEGIVFARGVEPSNQTNPLSQHTLH